MNALIIKGEGKEVIFKMTEEINKEIKERLNRNLMSLEQKLSYDTEGHLLTERKGTFKDGELNGEGIYIIYHGNWNRNKAIERRGIFKDDKLNGEGEVITYDVNGNKREKWKGTFKDGFLNNGELIFYDTDGNERWRQKRPYFLK